MVIKEFIRQVLGKDAEIVQPLRGGMMNKSYIVSYREKKYVLYVPNEHSYEIVNRYLEKESQDIAYKMKLTSKNVYFDTETGVKINEYIDGYSLNHVDKPDIHRVAGLLKYLHNSPKLSTSNYRPFTRLISYEKELEKYTKRKHPEYAKLRELLFANREFLESQERVLCHNDAQKSNIVLDKTTDKYYLIDFEFAGNNDPIYDIASYGNDSVKEAREVLDSYYGNPSKDEIKRLYLWRICLSLQWYKLSLIKHYYGEDIKHNRDYVAISKKYMENAIEAYEDLKKEK